MLAVERSIVGIGKKSDSRVLDRIASNYAKTEKDHKDGGMENCSKLRIDG